MTYIVSGKLKECCFLMADCISTNKSDNSISFRDKIIKMSSSDGVYFSFTGSVLISHAVHYMDERMNHLKLSQDFLSGSNSIKILLNVIQKFIDNHPDKLNVTLGSNRLFFLSKERVVYHDLEFTPYNQLKKSSGPFVLDENILVDSVINFPPEPIKLQDNEKLEDFCLRHITAISQNKVDFKNRFSFVQLNTDGSMIEKKPYQNFSDMVAEYYGLDYNIIDDSSFQWDII